MEGWAKLNRSSLEHWVFTSKDAEVWKIWCYCLMNAVHSTMQVMVKKRIQVTLLPGQLIFGRKQWGNILNINEFKVYRTIEQFKECGLLSIYSTKHYSVLTLSNSEIFHNEKFAQKHAQNAAQENTQSEPAENQLLSEEETQEDAQQMHKKCTHKKNVNNVKKKDNIYSSKVFDENSVPYKLAFELRRRIKLNDDKTKVPDENGLHKWAIEIDRMIRLDQRSEAEIRQVIDFSQTNSFWKSNVLSAKKLKEKFDTLMLQSKEMKSQKPVNRYQIPQQNNFEQRNYSDEFYESLYDNT